MLRLALTDDCQDDDTEESVTIAEAARRLGCATSTVRELLDANQLSGHRIGKFVAGKAPRGVRVHAASIKAYQRRHIVGGQARHAPAPPRPSQARNSAILEETLASLRKIGVRI
ncbi:MAG: helix-turn-helix domain-containing protein [Reyranella sp.]|nr:helix-turn-helix domain-containing protein [Reyranella sp.]